MWIFYLLNCCFCPKKPSLIFSCTWISQLANHLVSLTSRIKMTLPLLMKILQGHFHGKILVEISASYIHTTRFSSINGFMTIAHRKLRLLYILIKDNYCSYTMLRVNNILLKSSMKLVYLSDKLTVTIKFLSPIW